MVINEITIGEGKGKMNCTFYELAMLFFTYSFLAWLAETAVATEKFADQCVVTFQIYDVLEKMKSCTAVSGQCMS